MGRLNQTAFVAMQPYVSIVIPATAGIHPNLAPACAGVTYKRNRCAVMKIRCVYIMASQRNGTLYVGVTSNLVQRVWQHNTT